jgi:hypothetical protein
MLKGGKMTKRHHKCDDEHCSVHKALTDDVKKKLAKKQKPKVVKIQQDRWTDSINDISQIITIVKNEDSFVALQHCIKILEGIKKDHGY